MQRLQAGRESLTTSILKDPPKKVQPRKRSKKSNPQLEEVEKTMRQIQQKQTSSDNSQNKGGRRLYSSGSPAEPMELDAGANGGDTATIGEHIRFLFRLACDSHRSRFSI